MSKKTKKAKKTKKQKTTNASEASEQSLPTTSGHFASLLNTFISPLVVVVIWASIFGLFFGFDLFSQFGLRAKSHDIAQTGQKSDSSVVIEFDSESMHILGDKSDKRANLFAFVDELLASAKPKLIILDYQFSLNDKSDISFNPKYLNKVIWGSSPKVGAGFLHESGFNHNLFDFTNDDEKEDVKFSKNWGHMRLFTMAESNSAVQSVPLIISPSPNNADEISPALALLAYAKGEYQINGEDLRNWIAQASHDKSGCQHPVFLTLKKCEQLFEPFLFNVPPLPSFFDTYSASLFGENFAGIKNPQNKLKDKYVFITSTWDENNDYYHSSIAAPYAAFAQTFNLQHLFGFSRNDGKVPGAYFHATILENLLGKHFEAPTRVSILHWKNFIFGFGLAIVTAMISKLFYKIYTSAQLSRKIPFNENTFFIFQFILIVGLFFVTKCLVEWSMVFFNLLLAPLLFFIMCVFIGSGVSFSCINNARLKRNK